MPQFDSTSTAESIAKALANDIQGKTVIVTGVTKTGYGAEVARVLALVGARVVLAGRSLDKIKETEEYIKKETPTAELYELTIDLASQKSVRAAAAQVLKYPHPVDVVILNAGIMGAPYSKTEDGLESQFAINHIGNFLFTNLIMPKLLESSAPRVVSVASMGNTWGPVNFEDIGFDDGKKYNKWAAYGQSKSANVLFAVELAERYKHKNLIAFSMNPGGAVTGLHRYMTAEDFAAFSDAFNPDGTPKGNWARTIGESSATHISAAFDPSLAEFNGSYLMDSKVNTDPQFIAPHATDKNNAKKLWALSEELVGQKFDV
ncbi:hypothetical protein Clacol_003537 [Clathrus columnatus]|uniref:Uncharacterized protein n=1 Tax=Clathrus columnatus TaxID=1419009 RepID=A0AAV5A4V0_9AGAM|nr:hypothetical protein Clacol_003537 [Clathrus columnatus]